MAWPTSVPGMEREVDNQVAAPAETRTPNLHRAQIAQPRVRMEGWRQWRLGGREKPCPTKKPTWLRPAFSWKAITLRTPGRGMMSVKEIYRQPTLKR